MTTLALTYPDYDGKTAVTQSRRRIMFATLHQDQDCESPLESDGMGQIQSLSNRHTNHIARDDFSALTGLGLEEGDDDTTVNPDAVILSYFEHGNCQWGVCGSMSGMPDFRWDGTRVAGVWTPDSCLIELVQDLSPDDRRAKMLEYAAQACEVYTQWCNGNCYGYTVAVYDIRKAQDGTVYDHEGDYRHDTPVAEDSCWGFIGYDYALEEVKRAMAYCWKPMRARKTA